MKFDSIQKTQFFFVFFLFIINLIQASTLPLLDDEAYYWVWSKHPDFGYYDHPPMVALFIKAGYSLFPNMLGVRITSALSQTLFYIIWILIFQPQTKKENYLFLTLWGSVGIFQGLGFIATPDTALLLFCSFFIWRWKKFIENQNLLNSLLLGLSIALTLYSKYHGIVFIGLAFIPFIPSFYKNIWFWLCLVFSLVLFIPHLHWQYIHEWPSLKYHLHDRNLKIESRFFFGEWLVGLLAIANPLLLYFYGKSIFKKSDKKHSWLKSLQWIVVGGIIFFGVIAISRKVQPQWNLIIYLGIVPLTYYFYKQRKNTLVISLASIYMGLLLVMRILLLLPSVIPYTPMYKMKQFVLDARKKTEGIAVFERYQKASLYQFYTQQPSACLQVYTHRYSQYDLWNSEQDIQGKTITFFGLAPISSDYLLDEENKKEFYKTVPEFYSFPKISCMVTPTLFSGHTDSLQTLNIQWKNPYPENINIKKGSNLEAGIIFVDSKSLEPKTYIPFSEPIVLPSRNTIENTLFLDVSQIPSGEYKSYIVIQPFGISGKIISNPMFTSIP